MSSIILFLSVVLGFIIVYTLKPSKKITQLLLSFSGAYLLAITITHLLPAVFKSEIEGISIYIVFGLLIQLIMDYFSKGAEHGHMHVHGKQLPSLLFISLCLHAFMEGIPLGNQHHDELLWAIVVHKIPITIVLVSFLIHSKMQLVKALGIVLIFALMTPIGNELGSQIDFLMTYKTQINALIIGVFLHISTIIIFESSENHKFNIAKFVAILVGFGVAILI